MLTRGRDQPLSRFRTINESFVCQNCGADVPPSSSTCRNHCPFCLCSKHVDVFPGDRSNECGGLMKSFGYEKHKKKGLVLWFRCIKCGEERRNIALLDDAIQADDYEKILSLSGVTPGHS